MNDVQSLVAGTNADLLRQVAELYIEENDVIVDATYGDGAFWRRLPDLTVIQHDLFKGDGVDLRALPEAAGSVDVLALDPPYRLTEGNDSPHVDFTRRYGLAKLPELTNNAAGVRALIDLYAGGLLEATRVLSKRGRVFIKCQDFIDGKRIVPMGARIVDLVEKLELPLIDLFVLHSGPGPNSDWESQHRARRAHSYLIVAGRSRYWRAKNPRRRERVLAGGLFDERPESGDSGA